MLQPRNNNSIQCALGQHQHLGA